MLSERTAQDLEQAIRLQATMTTQLIATMKASLPQMYTLDDLQTRYHGKSRDEIRARLIQLRAIPEYGTQGKATCAHLDFVLLLDSFFAGRITLPALLKVA